MSKSSRRSIFGLTNRGNTVAVIEAPIARVYRRKALIAFWITAVVVGLLAGTVASHYWHPIVGALAGIVVGALCGAVVFVFISVWPVLRVLWHWLPEIVAGLVVVYGWTWLMQATPLWLSLLIVALVVGVPAAVGPIRRRVVAGFWCVAVRHRLRLCFAAFIGGNRNGALPLIGPARPTPAGERVWVWLRPGLSLKDLEAEGQMQRLAVACWANEVRVTRASRRYAALIRIDVTRREPLAADVASPLPDYIPADDDDTLTNAPTSPGMPPVGLDLPDVPDYPSAAEPVRPRRLRTTQPADPSGFDPSDYA